MKYYILMCRSIVIKKIVGKMKRGWKQADSAAALENGRAAKHGDLSVGKSSALVSNLDKVPRW